MKPFLLHPEAPFDMNRPLPDSEQEVRRDLEADTLLKAMADGDELIYDVSRKVLFSGLSADRETVLYRQEIVKDALGNPEVIRRLYSIAGETMEKRKKLWYGVFSRSYPSSILSTALSLMQLFVPVLREIRDIAGREAPRFSSRGFSTLFSMFRQEFPEDYLSLIQQCMKELRFDGGVLTSLRLSEGNTGTGFVLRRPRRKRHPLIRWILDLLPSRLTFSIHGRDEAGARILSELRDRGVNPAANALAQSSEHMLAFFRMLREELAFLAGCINLHKKLARLGIRTCFPDVYPPETRRFSFTGLRDPSLGLVMGRDVAANSVSADGKSAVIITGANQGGKSSFLRSLGLSQLMMRSGMFVPAESYSSGISSGIFTHYRREEDPAMKSGKLDEELGRLGRIAEHIGPDALLLLNESFASTNEREGSEISKLTVHALLEKNIKVCFVTHLYTFAHDLYEEKRNDTLFLRAERLDDGTRTFRMKEGEPEETSFGRDLYGIIFGDTESG